MRSFESFPLMEAEDFDEIDNIIQAIDSVIQGCIKTKPLEDDNDEY